MISVGFCSASTAAAPPAPATAPHPGLFLLGSRPPPPRRMAAVTMRAFAASKTKAAEETAGKRPTRGITKPRPISPALQALLGVKEIPRTQALKQIWAYIKEKDLQDPENRKIIVCDEKLKNIFGGKDRVGFLEISGLLNPHFQSDKIGLDIGQWNN